MSEGFLSAAWLKGASERAVKTFAQTFGASLAVAYGLGADGVAGFDWLVALQLAGVAALLSVLTSVAGHDFTAGVQNVVEVERVIAVPSEDVAAEVNAVDHEDAEVASTLEDEPTDVGDPTVGENGVVLGTGRHADLDRPIE